MSGPGLRFVGREEEERVLEVVRSRRLSRYRFGDDEAEPSHVYRFEHEMASLLDVPHCLGTNSCTSALFAGWLALDLPPGAEVIVPGYTFVASIASILWAGAVPVFAEVDDSLTLDPDDVAARIGPRTAAVLAVHMLGVPCDLGRLQRVCADAGVLLVEDVAQAGGGSFGGRRLGSFGAFGAFSLNHHKTFTAGDGGVLATRDPRLFERAFAIHDHGSRPYRQGVGDGGALLGLNLRMHELTGAMARAQLAKLPEILARCRDQKQKLIDAIGPMRGARLQRLPDSAGECANALVWLFDDAVRAERVAAALGTRRLIDSNRHFAESIGALSPPRLPRAFAGAAAAAATAPPSLPRSRGWLERAVALSVGVRDPYLGTGFGIDPGSTDAEIEVAARAFRAAAFS